MASGYYDDPIIEIAMPGTTIGPIGDTTQMYGMFVSPSSHCPGRVGGPFGYVSVIPKSSHI